MKPTPPCIFVLLVLSALSVPYLPAQTPVPPSLALECTVAAIDPEFGLLCRWKSLIQNLDKDGAIPLPGSARLFFVMGHPEQGKFADGTTFRAYLTYEGVKQGTPYGSCHVYRYLRPCTLPKRYGNF